MTLTISPDGFTALVRQLESMIEDTANTALNMARKELRETQEELKRVKNDLDKVTKELDKFKGNIKPPINGFPSFKPPFGKLLLVRKRREFPLPRSTTSFDVTVRSLTFAKLDSLDNIPILGKIIKVFANIILNLATFPLLALVLLTIFACFLYLCKIAGRLFFYLVFSSASGQKTKGAQCLSILLNIKSCLYEISWTIIVVSLVLVWFFIYVKSWSFLSGSKWTDCWLGLMTIECKRGVGVMQVKVACIFALIAIALNVIDQLAYAIRFLTCGGKTSVVNEQNKHEKIPWIQKRRTETN